MTLTLQDYLAIGFTIGLTIIYVPQYYKIIRMKSSIGFHPWFLFLGYMASTLSCINAVIYYWDTFWANKNIDWSPYIESISGFVLLIFQWFLFLLFYVVFVMYFDQSNSGDTLEDDFFAEEAPETTETQTGDISIPVVYTSVPPKKSVLRWFQNSVIASAIGSTLSMRTKRSNVILFSLAQIIGAVFLLITCASLHDSINTPNTSDWIHAWSGVLEIATLIMFCAHYAPQIWETIRLKRVGSLSLVTLGIMCPGTFVWTYFLANQSNASRTIWIPYLSVGIMQAVLLSIGIYYEIRDRSNRLTI